MAGVTEDLIYGSIDLSSFSNPQEVISTHIKLEWNLDFERQIITGLVEHIVEVVRPGTAVVCFDTNKIDVTNDIYIEETTKASYYFSDEHEVLGRKLSIAIPEALRYEGAKFSVTISYTVSPQANALQWLPATATKGGRYPFVFTQSQAIHARSLLPCMDTPGVKAPYTALVTAPKWCTVLMSALADASNSIHSVKSPLKQPIPNDYRSFAWTQPIPVSAYLIALAAGNLASKDISDRVRIWSEPEVIDAAHFEFSETEQFLQAAEDLTGCPYVWSRYDVLCLPPSFPYGGMENPCLTFATPTLLAGDRSLADVIAHEIAHSWTGNLITNQTWNHFWLNEGWTVWLERKIVSRVKRNDEVGRLSAEIGYKHLIDDVERFTNDNPFTQLIWPLGETDPDEAFSSVPYEKVRDK